MPAKHPVKAALTDPFLLFTGDFKPVVVGLVEIDRSLGFRFGSFLRVFGFLDLLYLLWFFFSYFSCSFYNLNGLRLFHLHYYILCAHLFGNVDRCTMEDIGGMCTHPL